MTNDAPEYIALSPEDAAAFGRKYGHPKIGFGPCVGDPFVGYTRADHAQAELQAAVAAEREACAVEAADQERACAEWFKKTGRHANVYEQFPIVEERIRARPTADAQAALEAVKREARNEALREAVAAAARTAHDGNFYRPHINKVTSAILALMEDTDDE